MENNKITVPELNNETIESMIYIVRGEKVMLDFELAQIMDMKQGILIDK